MFWVRAAKLYHRLKAQNFPDAHQQAVGHFAQHCQAKLFADPEFNRKILAFAGKLDIYISQYQQLGWPFVQTNKRVQFSRLPGHLVSGSIGRLDINPAGGYFATNFEAKSSDWKHQLRVAITQQALADELGCSSTEVEVGMYCIESGKHDQVCMPDEQIQQATREVESILGLVAAEFKRVQQT